MRVAGTLLRSTAASFLDSASAWADGAERRAPGGVISKGGESGGNVLG